MLWMIMNGHITAEENRYQWRGEARRVSHVVMGTPDRLLRWLLCAVASRLSTDVFRPQNHPSICWRASLLFGLGGFNSSWPFSLTPAILKGRHLTLGTLGSLWVGSVVIVGCPESAGRQGWTPPTPRYCERALDAAGRW